MSEYTPTTEAVRSKYARGMKSDGTPAQFVKWQKEFDRWLAAHDAEVRAGVVAEEDPAKDERLVRYMTMATPLGYQSALAVVQEMTKLIDAETRARSRSHV